MRRLLTGLAALSLSVAIVVPVLAFGGFLDQAVAQYPAIDGTALDGCILCHTTEQNPGPLNGYGQDFENNGRNFGAIEGLDSDGDGFTNLEEIQALTLPGDVTDFPQDDDDDGDDDDGDDGDGGGEGFTFVGRSDLAMPDDVTALAAATDTRGDQAMVVWLNNLVQTYDRVWLDGTVTNEFNDVMGIVVDAVGAPVGDAVRLDDEEDDDDVDPEAGLGAAYGRGRYLATWADGGGSLVRRVAQASGEPLGTPDAVASDGADSTATFDPDLRGFLVATTSTGAVAVQQLDRSGTLVGSVVPSQPLLDEAVMIPDAAAARSFALGDGGAGQVLIAADGDPDAPDLAPLGILLESGTVTSVSDPYAGRRAAALQAAAAFGADLPGMVAWRSGDAAWTAPLAADGSLAGDASRIRDAAVGAIGVAPLPDGNFLVVWTDASGSALMGLSRQADGTDVVGPAEFQEAGESVVPGVLAVVPLADGVLVAYVVDGDAPTLRTVVVAPE